MVHLCTDFFELNNRLYPTRRRPPNSKLTPAMPNSSRCVACVTGAPASRSETLRWTWRLRYPGTSGAGEAQRWGLKPTEGDRGLAKNHGGLSNENRLFMQQLGNSHAHWA